MRFKGGEAPMRSFSEWQITSHKLGFKGKAESRQLMIVIILSIEFWVAYLHMRDFKFIEFSFTLSTKSSILYNPSYMKF